MRQNDKNARKTVGTRLYRVRNSLIGGRDRSIADAIQSGPYRFSRIYGYLVRQFWNILQFVGVGAALPPPTQFLSS